MEVEQVFYLEPARSEGRQKQEAAAALLDLAGVPLQELKQPCCMADLVQMGMELKRQGSELVIRRDGDFRVVHLMSLQSSLLEGFRA